MIVVKSRISFIENASFYAELEERHKELVGETVEVGLMFASKAFVQLLANPIGNVFDILYEEVNITKFIHFIVGPLTHK